MKYLLLLFCFFINILSAEEFSLEAYSSTKRDRIKVADNFVYENIETNDKAWTVLTSNKQIDLDNKMYQFDTTAEIGKNIYLNGSGKYKSLIGYECTFAVKYYDEEYNFLVQKCKPPIQ